MASAAAKAWSAYLNMLKLFLARACYRCSVTFYDWSSLIDHCVFLYPAGPILFPTHTRSYQNHHTAPYQCLPRVQKPHRLQWFATPITCNQCSTVGTEISSYRHLAKIIQQCQGRLPARSFLTCLSFEIGKAMSRRDGSTMLIKRNS